MDCRSESEGKTDEGLGYDKRNVKDNPSSVATRQLPPRGKAYKVGAFLVRPPSKRNATLLRHPGASVETKAGANTDLAERYFYFLPRRYVMRRSEGEPPYRRLRRQNKVEK